MSILSLGSNLLAQTGRTGGGFWFPESGSTVAPNVDFVFDVITGISIFFFVLIVALMVFFVIKYRRKEHVADTAGPSHNTILELTWTGIPIILVVVIFFLGLQGYIRTTTPPENAYEIEATARQWSWTFTYPNGAQDTDNILHVPVGVPVKVNLHSDDVLHALFIPAFRVKMDAVPGKRTGIWFQAMNVGDYPLYCAEYCGTDHSQMVGTVRVYEPDEFEAVIDELASWIDKVPDENLHKAGLLLYNQCSSCHSIDNEKLVGPSFMETHSKFKSGESRLLADDSSVVVDDDYLLKSILSPGDQLASTDDNVAYPRSMPPGLGRQLGDRKRLALIEFIKRLDELIGSDGKLISVKRTDIVEEADKPQ